MSGVLVCSGSPTSPCFNHPHTKAQVRNQVGMNLISELASSLSAGRFYSLVGSFSAFARLCVVWCWCFAALHEGFAAAVL